MSRNPTFCERRFARGLAVLAVVGWCAAAPSAAQDWTLLTSEQLIAVAPGGTMFEYSTGGRLLRRSKDGVDWTTIYDRTNVLTALHVVGDSTLFLSTWGNPLAGSDFEYLRSDDLGTTWDDPCAQPGPCVLRFQAGTFGDREGGRYFTRSRSSGRPQGVFRHLEGDSSWVNVLDADIIDFAVSADNTLWGLYGGTTVAISVDQGVTWGHHMVPCLGGSSARRIVQVHASDALVLDLGLSGYVRWDVGEPQCEPILVGLVDSVEPLESGGMVAHFPDLGILRVFADLALTKSTIRPVPPHQPRSPLSYLIANDALLVVTSSGTYRGDFTLSHTAREVPSQPTRASIFPNPVSRDLFVEGEGLEVRLYDLLGRLFITDGLPARLRVGGLPAGVYLVQVRGRSWVHTQTVVKID